MLSPKRHPPRNYLLVGTRFPLACLTNGQPTSTRKGQSGDRPDDAGRASSRPHAPSRRSDICYARSERWLVNLAPLSWRTLNLSVNASGNNLGHRSARRRFTACASSSMPPRRGTVYFALKHRNTHVRVLKCRVAKSLTRSLPCSSRWPPDVSLRALTATDPLPNAPRRCNSLVAYIYCADLSLSHPIANTAATDFAHTRRHTSSLLARGASLARQLTPSGRPDKASAVLVASLCWPGLHLRALA